MKISKKFYRHKMGNRKTLPDDKISLWSHRKNAYFPPKVFLGSRNWTLFLSIFGSPEKLSGYKCVFLSTSILIERKKVSSEHTSNGKRHVVSSTLRHTRLYLIQYIQ